MTYAQARITSRRMFGSFLNRRDLIGDAVEIGTHRGEFAADLLVLWKGRMLTCVDPYFDYEGDGCLPTRGSTRRDDMLTAAKNLVGFGSRVQIVMDTSNATSKRTQDSSLDFVYIDGDHKYESVLEDLLLWWPKIKDGGVIAGHDVVCPNEIGGGWGAGVQRAIHEFVRLLGRDTLVYLVVEQAWPWSFYILKE